MNDDPSPRWSRRTALRAFATGALAATAGCQFATDGNENKRSTNRTHTVETEPTNPETNGTATRERTTATQEQTIISGSPAATAGSAMATTEDNAPAHTESAATTTAEPTSSTERTQSATRTHTPPATATATTTETARKTTATTTTPAEPPTRIGTPTPTDTATPTETATRTATRTETPTPTATETPTPTATETPTPTATETPTPTATETPTPTATPTDGQFGEWAEKAPLPVVGSDAGGGVLDGKLHFFGGIETGVELNAVSRAFAYDPSAGPAGSWERLPDLPRALWGPTGVATDDALYSFGGAPENSPYEAGPPTDLVFRYRPEEGWTNLTESAGVRCPYPNWVMGGAFNPADGLIYCVGGGTGDHDAETASNHGLDDGISGTYDERRLWTFDPANERVADADLARMPEPKRWPTVALFEVDGTQYLHAIAGLSGTTGPTDSNFRYDIGSGNWEYATPTPKAGTYATHSNPVIDNRAYLTHGLFWHGESTIERYKPIAHRYDPVSDSFETDLPKPTHLRGGATSGVIDGTLYVAGGHLKRFSENDLHDCVAYNEAYTPAGE